MSALRRWLEAEVRRVALHLAALWRRGDLVPSHTTTPEAKALLVRYLDSLAGDETGGHAEDDPPPYHEACVVAERRCAALRAEAAEAGQPLPIDHLVEAFSLSSFEEQVVLLGLTHSVEPRICGLVAALRGHEDLASPSVALALSLFSTPDDRVASLCALLPGGVLPDHGVVLLGEGPRMPTRQFTPIPERELYLPDWVVGFLLGEPDRLPAVEGRLTMRRAEGGLDALVLPDELNALLRDAVLPGLLEPGARRIVQLIGVAGRGRRTLAGATASEAGKGLLVAEVTDPAALTQVCAAARVHGAALHLCDAAALWRSAPDPDRALVVALERLASFPGTVFLSVDRAISIAPSLAGCPVIEAEVPPLSPELRRRLWSQALPPKLRPKDETLREVAQRYRLPAGDIVAVAEGLVAASGSSKGKRARLSEAALSEACARFRRGKLKRFGQIVDTGLTWDDLVLDDDLSERLDDVLLFALYRDTLFSDWGFERLYARGGGLSVLMSGPPGTGKTQTAELLAVEMQAPLLKVDTSRLIDKYIGETDKHVAALFDEAADSDAILFFDEADALFGKRVAVESSTDRFVNQTVNQLLQRIEGHPGVVILTTNLSKEIDPAFKRRFRFILDFRAPTEAQRAEIWKKSIPPEAPLAGRVRWAELGERFEMTGGHIRNAALRAALQAAHEGTQITGKLLADEARRELASLGRLVRD